MNIIYFILGICLFCCPSTRGQKSEKGFYTLGKVASKRSGPFFFTNHLEEKNTKEESYGDTLELKKVVVPSLGTRPLLKLEVTDSYGYRIHPTEGNLDFHAGLDLRASEGSAVFAVQKGVVGEIGYNSALGIFIKLICGDYTFVYGHLSEIYVLDGEIVKNGELIGATGETGRVTGPHLHFSVLDGEGSIDPELITAMLD